MERLEAIFPNQEREVELAKIFLKPLCETSPRSINLVDLLINYGSEIEATRTLLWRPEPVDFHDLFEKLRDFEYVEFLGYGKPTKTIVLGITELRMPLDAKDFYIRNYLERPLEAT